MPHRSSTNGEPFPRQSRHSQTVPGQGKTSAAAEEPQDTERFNFTPNSDQIVGRPVRAAHEQIGLLQSFCKHQQRSIETISRTVWELKSDIPELGRKVSCQTGTGPSRRSPRTITAKRRAPLSGDESTNAASP